jgi:nucleoid DNA-binding protein
MIREPHHRAPLTPETRALLAVIREALAAGQDVRLPGLGVLRVEAHAAHMGRNPRTGAAIAVPARKRVHFSRSREMHALLNP